MAAPGAPKVPKLGTTTPTPKIHSASGTRTRGVTPKTGPGAKGPGPTGANAPGSGSDRLARGLSAAANKMPGPSVQKAIMNNSNTRAIAMGAVSGAAKGVAAGGVGAVPGAAMGAGKETAKILVKSKKFWGLVAVIMLAPTLLMGGMIGGLFVMISGEESGTDTAQESASRAGVTQQVSEIVEGSDTQLGNGSRPLQLVAETSGADFYILAAILHFSGAQADPDSQDSPEGGWFGLDAATYGQLGEGAGFDDEAKLIADAVAAGQRRVFAGGSWDLASGYSLAVVDRGRRPIDDDANEQLRDQVHDQWVEVVESLPLKDPQVQNIVDQARAWKLNQGGIGGATCQLGEAGEGVSVPGEYQQLLQDAADHSGVPYEVLAAQLQQESQFNPDAVSPVGAQGIAQFMPGTWSGWGAGGDPFNPEDAIPAQGRYMKHLMEFVAEMAADETEQVRLALAAYNAGPGNVSKYSGIPPFGETETYVENITAAAGGGTFSVNCSTAGIPGMNVDGVGIDDYPHRDPVGVKGWGFPTSLFGHTQRECTDFVMWRINQAMGWTPGSSSPPPFTFSALGVGYGDGQIGAGSWVDILTQVEGIKFTNEPAPGDIAWWGYGDVGGGYGHVGFVAAVEGSQVTVEHYNYANVSAYSASQHAASSIPGYIRVTSSLNS